MLKKLALLTLIIGTAQAEIVQKNDRDIYDLMWLPPEGTVFGLTRATFDDVKFDVHTDALGKIGEDKTSRQELTQTLGYSLSQRLSLAVFLPYLWNEKKTDAPVVGPDVIYESKGLMDPGFTARWRVLDQSSQLLSVDLVPLVQISTGEFEVAADDKDGNGKSGGHNYGLRVEAGKKYTTLDWMVFLGMRNFQETEGKDLTSGLDLEQSSYSRHEAGVRVQGLIAEEFLLQGLLEMQTIGDIEVTEKSSGSKGKRTSSGSLLLGGGLTYLYSPALAFTADFGIGTVRDFREEDQLTRLDYKEGTISRLGLQARYQF